MMDPVTIINLSLQTINVLTKAIQAANEGDATKADVLLKQARAEFSQAVDDWDNA